MQILQEYSQLILILDGAFLILSILFSNLEIISHLFTAYFDARLVRPMHIA